MLREKEILNIKGFIIFFPIIKKRLWFMVAKLKVTFFSVMLLPLFFLILILQGACHFVQKKNEVWEAERKKCNRI